MNDGKKIRPEDQTGEDDEDESEGEEDEGEDRTGLVEGERVGKTGGEEVDEGFGGETAARRELKMSMLPGR